MRVEKDFEELLGLFNKHKVKYSIVGAFAVGFYGYPRYTKDIDIFVEPTLENGKKIVGALADFGFKEFNLLPDDFSKKGKIVQLGHEPVRADLITSIKGCSFSQVWHNRAIGIYGKEKVFFIGLPQLLRSKKLTNRKQDRVDLGLLQERLAQRKR